MNYRAEQYRDTETGRYRWAALAVNSGAWYFPAKYGKGAALRLAARLNKTEG